MGSVVSPRNVSVKVPLVVGSSKHLNACVSSRWSLVIGSSPDGHTPVQPKRGAGHQQALFSAPVLDCLPAHHETYAKSSHSLDSQCHTHSHKFSRRPSCCHTWVWVSREGCGSEHACNVSSACRLQVVAALTAAQAGHRLDCECAHGTSCFGRCHGHCSRWGSPLCTLACRL